MLLEHTSLRCGVLLILSLCGLALPAIAGGEVGDPTLRTDHPHYPGEGAFQTVEDCVRFATEGKEGEQERAIALYLWMLTHQWHLASPQEWNIPGETPDTARDNHEMVVYDANRARFSYGYGLCGTVHSWNEPYWRALGMAARRRAFPGHTNSEIFYGDSWHAFDTDMAGLVFRGDGVVAGYEDIIRNPDLVQHSRPPVPCYPFAWPGDFKGMQKGWREVAGGGSWYKLYNGGYAAQPGIVHLRRGETFTRYFDPDAFGGPAKRRFWHNQPGGPFRDWTFANRGEPEHLADTSNSRGNARYCNGVFEYAPDLSGSTWREGVAATEGSVASSAASPRLRSGNGGAVSITFSHFSPYVICGDPADDANPMSGKATHGLVLSGKAVGKVTARVSTDQGRSWSNEIPLTGAFEHDLTEQVKGRYGWWIQFSWADAASGLDELRFATTTQVCEAIYPRLKAGGSTVEYRAANRCVAPVLPNFGLAERELGAIEVTSLRSANVSYQPRSKNQRLAYKTTNNKPGQVVFRVSAGERPLTAVSAAMRYQVRVPPPDGCDYRLEVSTDEGKTWRPLAKAEIPADNEFSSGWLAGEADLANASAKTALVRATFYQGGYTTGLIDAEFYGIARTQSASGAVVTHGWKEAGESRTHETVIPAGADQHTYTVPTGEEIRDEFVRISVP